MLPWLERRYATLERPSRTNMPDHTDHIPVCMSAQVAREAHTAACDSSTSTCGCAKYLNGGSCKALTICGLTDTSTHLVYEKISPKTDGSGNYISDRECAQGVTLLDLLLKRLSCKSDEVCPVPCQSTISYSQGRHARAHTRTR